MKRRQEKGLIARKCPGRNLRVHSELCQRIYISLLVNLTEKHRDCQEHLWKLEAD